MLASRRSSWTCSLFEISRVDPLSLAACGAPCFRLNYLLTYGFVFCCDLSEDWLPFRPTCFSSEELPPLLLRRLSSLRQPNRARSSDSYLCNSHLVSRSALRIFEMKSSNFSTCATTWPQSLFMSFSAHHLGDCWQYYLNLDSVIANLSFLAAPCLVLLAPSDNFLSYSCSNCAYFDILESLLLTFIFSWLISLLLVL